MELSLRNSNILKATNLHVQNHLDEAIELYSQLINENADHNLLINRSSAYYDKNDFEKSLKDAEKALEKDPLNPDANLLKGSSLFCLGKFEAASTIFKELSKSDSPSKLILKWVDRCQKEMTNKRHLGKQENNEEKKEEVKKHHIYSKTGKLAYTWFQTDKTIGIIMDFRVEDRNKLKHKLEEDKIEISFAFDNNKDYNLNLLLWEKINPTNSKVIAQLESIEITLEKQKPSLVWPQLGKIDSDEKEELLVQENKAPLYPTSVAQKKDWNKIEKEVEEEIRQDQEKYGDARKGLIEALYNNSNEEQRKALAKSVEGSKGCYM